MKEVSSNFNGNPQKRLTDRSWRLKELGSEARRTFEKLINTQSDDIKTDVELILGSSVQFVIGQSVVEADKSDVQKSEPPTNPPSPERIQGRSGLINRLLGEARKNFLEHLSDMTDEEEKEALNRTRVVIRIKEAIQIRQKLEKISDPAIPKEEKIEINSKEKMFTAADLVYSLGKSIRVSKIRKIMDQLGMDKFSYKSVTQNITGLAINLGQKSLMTLDDFFVSQGASKGRGEWIWPLLRKSSER